MYVVKNKFGNYLRFRGYGTCSSIDDAKFFIKLRDAKSNCGSTDFIMKIEIREVEEVKT